MNTITHPCLICGSESEYSIPGMTKELYFCAVCIIESRPIPINTMSAIIREISPDTIIYLLSLISKNEILSDRTAAQESLISELKVATGYDILETMRSDRDTLVEEVSKLTSLLSQKEDEYNKLLIETRSANELKSDLTRMCSEFLDTSIERLIATTKKNTASIVEEQKNINLMISEVLTRVKQFQLEVSAQSPEPPKILPKRKSHSKESEEGEELSIENLEDEAEAHSI